MHPDKGAPTPPLRRRMRASLLKGTFRAAGVLPPGMRAALLRPLARAGVSMTRRRYIETNVTAALPWFDTHAPDAAARLRDTRRFHRSVADFVAQQTATWIRLARGASPRDSDHRDPGAWIDRLVDIDQSVDHLDRALAAGRGAIVVTAHIGNWDLLCARLIRRGAHGAVVGRVRRSDPSSQLLVDMRKAYGAHTIPQDASPRAMLEVLDGGGILGLLTDLRAKRISCRPVRFFGCNVQAMTAAPAFSRLSGAPIVMMQCVRSAANSRYVLSAEEPFTFDELLDGGLERDAAELCVLTRQNQTFERWIAASPEQWAWHQPRFTLADEAAVPPTPAAR